MRKEACRVRVQGFCDSVFGEQGLDQSSSEVVRQPRQGRPATHVSL